VAVLASSTVAPGAIVPVRMKVALPPAMQVDAGRDVAAPEAGQAEPTDAVQVQVALVMAAGSVSATDAPATADGPAFATTIV
jgi:hypothetical protein